MHFHDVWSSSTLFQYDEAICNPEQNKEEGDALFDERYRDEWKVIEILHRRKWKDEVWYKVKWRGDGVSVCRWENSVDLECLSMLRDFEEMKRKKRIQPPKKLRSRKVVSPPTELNENDFAKTPHGQRFLHTFGQSVRILGASPMKNKKNAEPAEKNKKNVDCDDDVKGTIMFHGCRRRENEQAIIQHGFQVSKCVSGGPNYGTWFAYNSSYSRLYSCPCSHGRSALHMFVCEVEEENAVWNTDVFRVVRQDKGFPRYIVCFIPA